MVSAVAAAAAASVGAVEVSAEELDRALVEVVVDLAVADLVEEEHVPTSVAAGASAAGWAEASGRTLVAGWAEVRTSEVVHDRTSAISQITVLRSVIQSAADHSSRILVVEIGPNSMAVEIASAAD